MTQIELDLRDIIDSATCAAMRRRLERYDTALSEFVICLRHLADEYKQEKICNSWNVARLRSRYDELCARFDSALKPLGLQEADGQSLRGQAFKLIDDLQEQLYLKMPSFPDPKSPKTDKDRKKMINEAAQSLQDCIEKLEEVSKKVKDVLSRKRELGKQISEDVKYLIQNF